MRRLSTRTPLLPAAFNLLFWLAMGAVWFRGVRRVPVLREVHAGAESASLPSVTVVVPARDEMRAVEEAVRSMLAQDYAGRLEVVAVDDRSSDGTAAALDSLSEKHPNRLQVIHVAHLPDGWLGKNHALSVGASRASGEWLLFTDADVWFAPDCLRRALGFAVANRLDLLAVAPELISGSRLLGGFVAVFEMLFVMTQRPWRAKDPRAREHVGIGAFNLVRREAYEASGGHRPIRMRPDDDMRLARLLKREGYSQEVASGVGMVSVEWHQTVGGAVRGLGKSIFPAMDYRPEVVALVVPVLISTNVLPFAGAVLARGTARTLSLLTVVCILLVYARQEERKGFRTAALYAALHPFSMGAFAYAALRSTITTLANGGIEWRGTRYPLEKLKQNRA